MQKISSLRNFIMVCLILLTWTGPLSAQLIRDPSTRGFITGDTYLFLGNTRCGFLKNFSGGNITGEVVNEPAGPNYIITKHISQPKYEDARFEIGFSMTRGIYDWITDSLNSQYNRMDVSVAFLDSSQNAKSQVTFYQSLLTELTIPECNIASKEPAYIGMTITPEHTASATPSLPAVLDKKYINEQKLWLPPNFELTIDGLDCTSVSKIDSFTIKLTAVTDDIGDARDSTKEPGKLEFPNLRITLPARSVQTWKQWFDSFVIQGNNDQQKEKSGHLDFLSPQKTTLFASISFKHLGIYKLYPEGDNYVAELYCEEMDFGFENSVLGSSGSTVTTRSLKTNAVSTEYPDITGIWDVTMGKEANHHFYMYQENGKISGVMDDRMMISGSMNGNVYTGIYYSTVNPNGASFTMTVADDGLSFSGTYRQSVIYPEMRGVKDTEKTAQIIASPTGDTPSPGFAGTWGTTGGDIFLKVEGTKVSGTWGDKTINGTVNGNVINGRYYLTSYPELLWDFNMVMRPDGKTGVMFHTRQGGVLTNTWRK